MPSSAKTRLYVFPEVGLALVADVREPRGTTSRMAREMECRRACTGGCRHDTGGEALGKGGGGLEGAEDPFGGQAVTNAVAEADVSRFNFAEKTSMSRASGKADGRRRRTAASGTARRDASTFARA